MSSFHYNSIEQTSGLTEVQCHPLFSRVLSSFQLIPSPSRLPSRLLCPESPKSQHANERVGHAGEQHILIVAAFLVENDDRANLKYDSYRKSANLSPTFPPYRLTNRLEPALHTSSSVALLLCRAMRHDKCNLITCLL